MPSKELLDAMMNYNEELVKAGVTKQETRSGRTCCRPR